MVAFERRIVMQKDRTNFVEEGIISFTFQFLEINEKDSWTLEHFGEIGEDWMYIVYGDDGPFYFDAL